MTKVEKREESEMLKREKKKKRAVREKKIGNRERIQKEVR